MAIFTENEELQRQGTRVPMDKVGRGSGRGRLKLLGYKDTGEFNKWGKFLSSIPIPGVSTARNLAARNISKGTDTNKVLLQEISLLVISQKALILIRFSKKVQLELLRQI
jgi:hypothetical protein